MNQQIEYDKKLKLLLEPFIKNNNYYLDPVNPAYNQEAPKIAELLEEIIVNNIEPKNIHRDIFSHFLEHSNLDFSRSLKNFSIKIILEQLNILFSQALLSEKNENLIFDKNFLKYVFYDANNKPIIRLDNPLKTKKIFTTNFVEKEEFINFIINPDILNILKFVQISNINLENFFSMIRFLLLDICIENPEKINKRDYIDFSIALGRSCFNSEFCWIETADETKKINKLKDRLVNEIKLNNEVLPIEILTVGSYEQLFNLKEIKGYLLTKKDHSDLESIIKEQLIDFIKEEEIEKDIKKISKFNNSISIKVKDQYENFPYPRWDFKNLSYSDNLSYFDYIAYESNSKLIKKKKIKKLLVAGCGTGRHPINIALTDSDIEIHALDLSLRSLSYGSRKAQEMGINNIIWLNGDINELKSYNHSFDVIESVGVLHHMQDPKLGFDILKDKLNSRGLIKLGLYSRVFRKLLQPSKDLIYKKKFTRNIDSVREARSLIMTRFTEKQYVLPTKFMDFYSASSFVDLLLHEQELDFEINDLIKLYKDDFNFLGFSFTDRQKIILDKLINKSFTNVDIGNINNLEKIEELEKTLFSNMYQFWVQKK